MILPIFAHIHTHAHAHAHTHTHTHTQTYGEKENLKLKMIPASMGWVLGEGNANSGTKKFSGVVRICSVPRSRF